MSGIKGYHAHIYYDATSFEQARALCEAARDRFALSMGHMHERPVGPHPMWSCQLGFAPEAFGDIVPWLALNRDGLIVFIHPDTGDALKDHRDHAIWMGAIPDLDLTMFGQG